ncbi:MAG: MTH1187 family thiamine-binding protein [Deltaproteobacteria bacterium]
MLVEFSINPMERPHMSKDVARVLETLEQSGFEYRIGPMSTCIEGRWEDVMAVIHRCHSMLAEGHPRVLTTITIDDRKERPHHLKEVVPAVERQLGHAAQH